MGDFYEEFAALCADSDSFRAALTLTAPEWPTTTGAGDILSFETTDLDGNTLTSDEIFADHKVTMINVWATWCGPCVGELPELQTLSEAFEAKECQIVGLCYDAIEEGTIGEAKDILAEAGAGRVGMGIAPQTPLRTGRAAFPHPAPYGIT